MQRYQLNRDTALVLLAILIPAAAWGNGGARQEGGRPGRPPQEAFAACENRNEGDRVTVGTPRGETITATCRGFEGRLAAHPDGPPPGQPGEGRAPGAGDLVSGRGGK